jgi:predicted nuclease of predicted toxin-antitoxin system
MRLLADENFPKPSVDWLRRAGHDVQWARTDCPGSKDTALLERAEAEARILLTLDKDFRQIALQRRGSLARAGVVLFRVHPATPAAIAPLLRAFVRSSRDWPGHVSTVSSDGIQMVPAKRAR